VLLPAHWVRVLAALEGLDEEEQLDRSFESMVDIMGQAREVAAILHQDLVGEGGLHVCRWLGRACPNAGAGARLRVPRCCTC